IEAATDMTMPTDYCDGNITPEITVTNNGSSTIDDYEVAYSLDGAALVTQAGTNLAASASATISFPAITLTNGSHNIEYSVNTDGTMDIDSIPGNNDASSGTINTVSPTAFTISHGENFESYAMASDDLNNAILINPNGENTYVVDNGVSSSVTWPLGAFGNSDQSWRMRFFTWGQGSEATIVFENIDLSTWGGANGTNSDLFFSYAYAQYSSENDRLEVLVSKNCGATWIPVFDEQGSGLATAPALSTGHFYPGVNQWVKVNVDMSYYDGESAVMIAFKGTSDYGNNLYIDDIGLWNYSTIDETSSNQFNVRTYPNPINDVGQLELTLAGKAEVQVGVYDMLGQMVIPVVYGKLAPGTHNFDMETASLDNGIYLVKVQVDGQVQTSRIIISD
ncbi:MAG TPA: T9SS type A sorting domain-containing protein, partial [Flavobacteriales bacterium]|nr:T9SS type A sorting domain-containing protein [Flavobacteriales bacterium]